MVLPQEAMMGLLPQLLGKLKPGPTMGAAWPGQVPPQPMAPPPPGMQMPPTMTPGGSMGLPPTPFPEPGIDPRGTGTGGRDRPTGEHPDVLPDPPPGPVQQPHTPVPPDMLTPPLNPPVPPDFQTPLSPVDVQPITPGMSPPSALERVQGMPDPLQRHGGTGPRFGGPTPTLQGLRQDAMKSPPPRTPQSPYNPGGRLNPSPPPVHSKRMEQANRPFPL